MTDAYDQKRARVAALLKRWNSGTITLTRTTPAEPDAETPWKPSEDAPTVAVYTLDARADGVSADYVNDATILATDLMVIASPKATRADGTVVELVPSMPDVLAIDGAPKVIKKIEAVPAAGPAARFHIFIAS